MEDVKKKNHVNRSISQIDSQLSMRIYPLYIVETR
jgi:hypothetical protein